MTPEEVAELDRLSGDQLRELWPVLTSEERSEGFAVLPREEAEEVFLSLSATDQTTLLSPLPEAQRRGWLRLLAPDDAADLLQEIPEQDRAAWLSLLDGSTRTDVSALLAYAEDEAGGLMNTQYTRLRPDMRVDEAINYLRKQFTGREESDFPTYVLDSEQKVLGAVTLRTLFCARSDAFVREIMDPEVITVPEGMDQEQISHLFADYDLITLPVVDVEGRMKGVVTVDDIVDVVQEEATEDIQKFGGVAAFEQPYLDLSLGEMFKKRIGWLAVLFIGEMLTATAMAYFEEAIARAVVLAMFVPLIISSGGNSGSQASTLVIRAMALGEVRLRDFWRVARREFITGLSLGLVLGVIGFLRIVAWDKVFHLYGEHGVLLAFTVGTTLVGIVLWGVLAGSMLPFVLRRVGLDPASASAPFVATLVDVSGIVIYFAVASAVLAGTLL